MKRTSKVGISSLFLVGVGVLLMWKFPFIKSLISIKDMGIKMKDIKIKATIVGLDISVTPVIENPQNTTLEITQPFVRIYDRQSVELASSNLSAVKHTIKPISVSLLDPIKLSFTWLQLLGIFDKAQATIPPGVNKALYIATNWQRMLQHLGLQMQISTHTNGIYYKSEPMKLVV